MPLKTTPWNIQDYLNSDEEIAGFLEAVVEDGTPELLDKALRDIQIARNRLHKGAAVGDMITIVHTEDPATAFINVAKHIHDLGFEMSFRPIEIEADKKRA
jgi:DNA-binding phage protein